MPILLDSHTISALIIRHLLIYTYLSEPTLHYLRLLVKLINQLQKKRSFQFDLFVRMCVSMFVRNYLAFGSSYKLLKLSYVLTVILYLSHSLVFITSHLQSGTLKILTKSKQQCVTITVSKTHLF